MASTLWNYLKTSKKPVVLYGMGDAAERIKAHLDHYGVSVSGIFASDEFVRGQEFLGYKVTNYADAKKAFGDMIVLLCFGSHLKSVIDNIKRIAAEQELYAPDIPVVGAGLYTAEYERLHADDIKRLYDILTDEKSRLVLDNILSYRKSGKIDYLFNAESSDEENMRLLGLEDDEIYMDLGAYNGDSVAEYINYAKSYKKIYAVEPEERNFRKLCEYAAGLSDIECVNAAVGKEKSEIMFSHGLGRGGAKKKGKTRPTPQESVDSILQGEEVSYIKMDLEGEEMSALIGGADTIVKYKPKMLIAAYHRIDDLWTIPNEVLKLNPGYKVYLRKSPCLPCWETNYYFV